MHNITLNNNELSLRCRLQGGALLNLATPDGVNILRPTINPLAPPGECALFPMLPMANRVEGNAFHWRGKRISLPSSPYDERFFLHGDGWLRPWTLEQRQPDSVTLALASVLPGVCRYDARLRYQLQGGTLLATLGITNTDDQPFPFGLGFHPFFTKTPAMTLWFEGNGYWPEREHHLPAPWRDTLPAGWNFSSPRVPGDKWINNAFSGWPGRAALHDALDGSIVTLSSSADILMVYQPDGSDFICLEPQTHPVNAHRQPGLPGLAILEPGESVTLAMQISRTVQQGAA
ncbi:aldose 1-epimerase [Sodalis ligni]|uniref:aldose 1-epimerase n=1 Tax=Sodalis ligni TaxID=2697027 RepID=UPI0019400CF0|nr:aldose 1-epimerase [Sodalis ligni]QWA10611.1 aldose 1-epimerase [Sodalis ligni]